MFNEHLFDAAIAAKGEKQDDAAQVMGIHLATLYRKKHGDSDFYRSEIEAFCIHYGVGPDAIFFATVSA